MDISTALTSWENLKVFLFQSTVEHLIWSLLVVVAFLALMRWVLPSAIKLKDNAEAVKAVTDASIAEANEKQTQSIVAGVQSLIASHQEAEFQRDEERARRQDEKIDRVVEQLEARIDRIDDRVRRLETKGRRRAKG